MNYLEVYDEIVSILHNDYAGCIDKKGWDDPEQYKKKLFLLKEQGQLDDPTFVQVVADYLLDFKDPHMHIILSSHNKIPKKYAGFKVRRFENSLYVTEAEKETRVEKGWIIHSLNGIPIPDLEEKHKRTLMETKPERQPWGQLFSTYKTIEGFDLQGRPFQMELKEYELESKAPEYSLKTLNKDTLFLKMTDFWDGDAIERLLKENEEELLNTPNLIIDVRINGGGDDTSYFKLLNYIFDKSGSLEEVIGDENNRALINCTHNNYEIRVAPMLEALDSIESEETRRLYQIFINELKKNVGKGFVELDFSELVSKVHIQGTAKPEKVIVLTDFFCGSSGDQFVEACKKSSKVTVVGRATMGITDYSNVAFKKWGNSFELLYPTSRSSRIDTGDGLTGIGVQPDIYLPWTPDHLFEDVDLKTAIALCEESRLAEKQ